VKAPPRSNSYWKGIALRTSPGGTDSGRSTTGNWLGFARWSSKPTSGQPPPGSQIVYAVGPPPFSGPDIVSRGNPGSAHRAQDRRPEPRSGRFPAPSSGERDDRFQNVWALDVEQALGLHDVAGSGGVAFGQPATPGIPSSPLGEPRLEPNRSGPDHLAHCGNGEQLVNGSKDVNDVHVARCTYATPDHNLGTARLVREYSIGPGPK
jgi:hypothetical protein